MKKRTYKAPEISWVWVQVEEAIASGSTELRLENTIAPDKVMWNAQDSPGSSDFGGDGMKDNELWF